MSYTPSKSDLESTLDRRRHPRQRIESLCPVSLGADNGGIVLDIGEGGLAIQTIGILADNLPLEVRVGLPSHGPVLQVQGQVAWRSESKKQAGVTFIGLPEQSRKEIREWILKQNPSEDLASATVRPSDKESRVVAMPPSSGSESCATSAAWFNKRPDFEAMFPSEKTLGLRDATVPVAQPGPAERPAERSATSMKDWVANVEQRAKAAKAKFGELADAAPPEVSGTTIAPAAEAEKIVGATSPQERVPIMSASTSSILASVPSTSAPEPSPPVETGHDSGSDLTAESQIETMAVSEQKFDSEMPPSLTAAGEDATATESDRTVVAFPATGEVAAHDDPPPSWGEKESATPPPIPQMEVTKVLPKSVAGDSDQDMILGLRAAIERRYTGKSLTRREMFGRHAPQEASLTSAANVPREAVRAASAVNLTPATSNTVLPVPAQTAAKEPSKGDEQVAESEGKNSAEPTIPAQGDHVQPHARTVLSRRTWMPLGVTLEQAAAVMLTIALLVGIGLSWRALKPQSEGHSITGDSVAQRMSDLTKAADELDSEVAAASHSSPVDRVPGKAGSSVAKQHQKPALSSITPNNPQTGASAAAVVAATKQAIEGSNQAAASAPPLQSSKLPNSGAVSGAPDSAVAQKPNNNSNDSPPTSGAAVSPQTQTVAIASAPSTGGAGDRVVPTSLLYSVQPLYPTDAAQKHIEGTVKLTAVVGKDGKVMGLGVVSGPNALVPAALSAAREWRYVPALLNGEPVETQTDITIEFRLPAGANP
jgi:TonB family protein